MSETLSKTYDPSLLEPAVTARWLEVGAFEARPAAHGEETFVVMMPLPNITGALHMGHAIDNTLQDLLARWQRMQGKSTLYQPGTDHAGIATQAVIEKRLLELEGKTRRELGREALVERIWAWKADYQKRIVSQQQRLGCSADWRRQRFTMDAVCSAAVREAFFRLFADALIYRGDRIVNWDCQLETAVADDEIYHETVQGHFWHLRYPVIDPLPGEPRFVVVATTRPETMLGDTAVACHPDPRRALKEKIAAAEGEERELLRARQKTHLPLLEQLVAMAKDGRKVMLPLMDRPIPIILDEWAKPELGSGCVKITPAHDPNDYQVWRRHKDRIGVVNVLEPDGKLGACAGAFAGLDRYAARTRVLAELEAQGLIEQTEDREIEVGHSDRSKTPIEPYLSKQWFVSMGDREGGVRFGAGTSKAFTAPGLAQAAIDVAGQKLSFYPARYITQYTSWLSEKRDWCISRQLWWGHRIPVWTRSCATSEDVEGVRRAVFSLSTEEACVWLSRADGTQHPIAAAEKLLADGRGPLEAQVCLRDRAADTRHAEALAAAGFTQDPDVLDTWFSSSLWPFSTLGWPDPEAAAVEEGQTPLGARAGAKDSFATYYPGSCLVTARDIITLWVARMVVMGLYNHGEVPFADCFVHAKILDGNGVTMSKSKGNGIDPVDMIERYGADAVRYVMCDLETGMQDVRLPVQATCPACGEAVELTKAKHGRTIFTYLCTKCDAEFDVLGSMPEVPAAKASSERFEVGAAFCNKLWNAARFAFMNLGELSFQPLALSSLPREDRWILSRLAKVTREVHGSLASYRPSAALERARDFFWGDLCDWYLELIKPRLREEESAVVPRQVLAAVLDQVLRLLHPFVPFITEALWRQFFAQAPARGVTEPFAVHALCMLSAWPAPHPEWEDEALEAEMSLVQQVISGLRELRSRHGVPPKKLLPAVLRAPEERLFVLSSARPLICDLARLTELRLGATEPSPPGAATKLIGDVEVFLGEVLDVDKERARLAGLLQKLEAELLVCDRKLLDEKFTSRAPAHVVEAQRQRREELLTQSAVLRANLEALA